MSYNKVADTSTTEVSKVRDLLAQISLVVKSTTANVEEETTNPQDESTTSTSSNTKHSLKQTLETFQTQNQEINLNTIFDLITPNLFYKKCDNGMDVGDDSNNDTSTSSDSSSNGIVIPMSQSQALQIIIGIVSTNPDKYTLIAMTSILNYIQASSKNKNHPNNHHLNEFNPTSDFIHTIVRQIQHPSTEISQCSSKILSELSSTRTIPSSPIQRHIVSSILLLLYRNVETNVKQLIENEGNNVAGDVDVDVDASILLIRNLSLMIEIMIPTSNTSIFLHLSSLLSSLQSPNPLFSTISTAASSSSSSSTILDPITTLMNQKNDDPLLIMNIFEILEKITSSTNSILQSWIDTHMVVQILLSQVGFRIVNITSTSSSMMIPLTKLVQSDDIDEFNYISALTILSKCSTSAKMLTMEEQLLAQQQQQQQILSPEMLITIFQYILNHRISESRDDSEKIRYIGAITNFITDARYGDNDERMTLLMREGNILKFWWNLKQGNSEYKAAVLHSIAQILTCTTTTKEDEDKDEGVPPGEEKDNHDYDSSTSFKSTCLSHEMCVSVHNGIGYLNGERQAMVLYMEQMKSSIDEIRLATYEIIKASIVNRKDSIGIAQIIGHDGFLTLLLTRNVECTKEGKELKYDIVGGILKSDMKRLLSASHVNSLEKYGEQGPYHIDAVSGDVLIE